MKTNLLLAFLLFCILCNAQVPAWDWAKGEGRRTSHDYCYSLCTDVAGNSYITGEFQDTIDFGSITLVNPGLMNEMMFIAKFDAAGNIIWAKIPSGNNGSVGNSICVDKNGYIYVTGSYRGTIDFGTTTFTAPGGNNFFLAKYDTAGNNIWAQRAAINAGNQGRSVCVGGEGNVYVTGMFEDSAITFGNITLPAISGIISQNVFVVKYDMLGNPLWGSSGGAMTSTSSYGICTDQNENVFVTGSFRNSISFGGQILTATNSGSATVFLVKFNNAGVVQWAQCTGTWPSSGYGNCVSTDATGNAYIAGYFNSQIIIFGNDTLTNAGVNDIFIAKYDSIGNVVWARSAGGNNFDQANSILTDLSGNSYITGFFKSSMVFGASIVFGQNQELFVAKYDSSGNDLWAVQASGGLNEVGHGIGMDANGDIYVGGTFTSDVSAFGSTTLVNSDPFTGSYDLFVAKLGNSMTGIPEFTNDNILISPNPFTNRTRISFDNPANEKLMLTIYDSQGRIVKAFENIRTNYVELDRSNFTSGLYFCRVTGNNKFVITLKLIVE